MQFSLCLVLLLVKLFTSIEHTKVVSQGARNQAVQLVQVEVDFDSEFGYSFVPGQNIYANVSRNTLYIISKLPINLVSPGV